MSRKEFDVSRMRRMKRIAARHGLTILTSDKIKVLGGDGGHAIRDDATYKVIFGDVPKPFSASFEQIEEYIEKLVEGKSKGN